MNKTKSNILFRISGGQAFGKELGTGHIYRSMNLAKKLISHNIFFLLEDYGNSYQILAKNGFKNIKIIKKEISLNSDIDISKKTIQKNNIDILIIDKFDSNTKKYAKHMHKLIKTIVIPDVNKIDYDVDLVINGFIGYKNSKIKNRFGTRCLLGPKYQILNEQFEKNNSRKKEKFSLLVTFGGFDEHNLLDLFCSRIENFIDKISVKIILGAATKKSKKVRLLELKYPKSVKIINSTNNMKKELSDVEYGLCSGGITTYEFASLGIPFAIICQYKHQLHTAKEWNKKNIALNLGYPNSQTKFRIDNFLEQIISKKINLKTQKSLVDGFGAKRISNEILGLIQ